MSYVVKSTKTGDHGVVETVAEGISYLFVAQDTSNDPSEGFVMEVFA